MDLDDRELEIQLREALHRAAEPVHGEGLFKETIRNEAARRQAARTRARWTGRLILAGAAVAAAVALFVLVKPEPDRVDTDGGTGPVATEPEVPTTAVTPDPTDPQTGTVDPPATSTSSTAPSTTTSSTTPRLPEFPPEFAGMAHGQPAWGLYLAVVPPEQYDAPELAAASAAAEAAGYGTAGGGDVNCDQGAYEALGVEQNSVTSAVYFETEALANQAKAAFEARGTEVVGIVQVTTYCMD